MKDETGPAPAIEMALITGGRYNMSRLQLLDAQGGRLHTVRDIGKETFDT